MRKGLGGFQDSGGSELTIYCIDSCLFLSSSPSSLLSLPALLGDRVAVVDELKRRAEEIPGLRMRRGVRGSQDSGCSKLHPNHPSIPLCTHQFFSYLVLPGDIWLWSCSRWEEDPRTPNTSRRLRTPPNHPSMYLSIDIFVFGLIVPGFSRWQSCSRWEEELEDPRTPSRRLRTPPQPSLHLFPPAASQPPSFHQRVSRLSSLTNTNKNTNWNGNTNTSCHKSSQLSPLKLRSTKENCNITKGSF